MSIKRAFLDTIQKLLQKANYRDYNFQYGDDSSGNYIPRLCGGSDYKKLYSEVKSWVFNAVTIRAEDVSKTTFRLYKQTNLDNTPSIKEIFDHPIVDLFLSPHPDFSFGELLNFTVLNMDVIGTFYWILDRDRMKVCRRLRPLFAWHIKPVLGDDGLLSHYHYDDGVHKFDIDRDDVIQFKHPKAGDLYNGQSILLAIADVININNNQLQYQLESFNQPIPPVSLETDKDLGLTIARELQEEFKEKYGGVHKISKVPVLDNGLKLNIHKRNSHEIDFMNSRKGLRDEILAAFRTPANKFGIVTDVNKANADAADYSYLANAIDPICRYFSMKLTQAFSREFKSPGLIIKHDDVVPKDILTKLKYYESGLKYKWLTVDEVRLAENYDPLQNKKEK